MASRRCRHQDEAVTATAPTPTTPNVGVEDLVAAVRAMTWRDVTRAVIAAVVTFVALGIPADIIENSVFGRPIPVRAIDVVILAVSAVLTGLIVGLRPPELPDAPEDRPMFAGAFVTFFAVGCPVCNRLVVSLIGTSGALNWFRPLQPVLGLLAVGLLLVALHRRVRTFAIASCPVG